MNSIKNGNEQVISMLEFLIDNICVSFGGALFQQIVGIPMGTKIQSDFTAPNLPFPLRLKGSGCHYNSSFNNTGTN
jgi:hypothetical protein